MKKILLVSLTAVVAASAFCQATVGPAKKMAKAPRTEITCAIMKDHTANIKEATSKKLFSDYKGNRYFFCCAGCKPAFDKNPAKYAKAPSIPVKDLGKIPAAKG